MSDGPSGAELQPPGGPDVGPCVGVAVRRPGSAAAADLLTRIVRAELLRRLPDAVVVAVDALAAGSNPSAVDLIVAIGDARASPITTSISVATVDESIAALAPRVFDAELLDRRREVARRLGWLSGGDALAASEPFDLPIEDVLAKYTAAGAPPAPDSTIARAAASFLEPVDAEVLRVLESRFDDLADSITAATDARWRSVVGGDAPPRWWTVVRECHQRLRELDAAYDARGVRLMTERVAMADVVSRLLEQLEAERDQPSVDRLEREIADLRQELARHTTERSELQTELARARAEQRAVSSS